VQPSELFKNYPAPYEDVGLYGLTDKTYSYTPALPKPEVIVDLSQIEADLSKLPPAIRTSLAKLAGDLAPEEDGPVTPPPGKT